jgi:phosphocarrier protein
VKACRKVVVKNGMGLHTRPATLIVKMLQKRKSHVSFTYKKTTINAKSILSLLMLAAKKNTALTITCEGEDAEETLNELSQAFDEKFGEDP